MGKWDKYTIEESSSKESKWDKYASSSNEESSIKKPSINFNSALKEGISSVLRPSPQSIGMAGLDPVQNFAQTTLQNLYGQSREQLIDKMLGEQQSPGIDWGRGVAGIGVDIGVGTLMGSRAIANRLAKPISNLSKNISSKLSQSPELAMKIWKSGGRLKDVERGISNVEGAISGIDPKIEGIKSSINSTLTPDDLIRSAQQNSNSLGAYGEGQIAQAKNMFKSEISKKSDELKFGIKKMSKDLYDSVINDNKAARQKAISFRNQAIKQYGEAVNIAEDRAIKSGKQISAGNYYSEVIKPTLDEFAEAVELKGSSATEAVKKIQSVASELANKPVNKSIGFKEIKDIKNKLYDPNDWVANNFFRKHSEFISKVDPELNVITSDYRPVFEANKWAKNNFQTMTSESIENSAGALGRITKAISSGKQPSAKDVSYIKIIESGSPKGIFKGVGEIGASSKQKALDIYELQKQVEVARKQLQSQLDDKIEMIKQSINEDRSSILTQGYSKASEASSKLAFLEQQKLGYVQKQSKMGIALSKLKTKEKELSRLNKIRTTLIATAVGSGLYAAFSIPKFVGYHVTQAIENAPTGN